MNQKTKRRNVTIALMVATFLAAIEGTIVSTAMPTIVSDLGGIKLISWVFAAYLLTSAITTPIYGKLADLDGHLFDRLNDGRRGAYDDRIDLFPCFAGHRGRSGFADDLYHYRRHLFV